MTPKVKQFTELVERVVKIGDRNIVVASCDHVTSFLKQASSEERLAAEPAITQFVAAIAKVANMTKNDLIKIETDLTGIDLMKKSRIQGEHK